MEIINETLNKPDWNPGTHIFKNPHYIHVTFLIHNDIVAHVQTIRCCRSEYALETGVRSLENMTKMMWQHFATYLDSWIYYFLFSLLNGMSACAICIWCSGYALCTNGIRVRCAREVHIGQPFLCKISLPNKIVKFSFLLSVVSSFLFCHIITTRWIYLEVREAWTGWDQ